MVFSGLKLASFAVPPPSHCCHAPRRCSAPAVWSPPRPLMMSACQPGEAHLTASLRGPNIVSRRLVRKSSCNEGGAWSASDSGGSSASGK